MKEGNLIQLLIQNPVASVHPDKPLVTVTTEDSLSNVMRKLCKENIACAPVIQNGRYAGLLRMIDIVGEINLMFFGRTEYDWVEYLEKSDEFSRLTVDDVFDEPNEWDRDPFPPVCSTSSLFFALELLVRNGTEQIAVVDKAESSVVGIITSSMFLDLLLQYQHLLGSFKDLTVKELLSKEGCGVPTQTVPHFTSAINAFNKMRMTDCNSVAVVDVDGSLVDSISARDLRGVGPEGGQFCRLYNSAADYKKLLRRDDTMRGRSAVPLEPLAVASETTVLDIIKLMTKHRVHQVYKCEGSNNPKGSSITTISQIDILFQLLQHVLSETAKLRFLESSSLTFESSTTPLQTVDATTVAGRAPTAGPRKIPIKFIS